MFTDYSMAQNTFLYKIHRSFLLSQCFLRHVHLIILILRLFAYVHVILHNLWPRDNINSQKFRINFPTTSFVVTLHLASHVAIHLSVLPTGCEK